MISAGEKLGP